jgi:hypothetical protein
MFNLVRKKQGCPGNINCKIFLNEKDYHLIGS